MHKDIREIVRSLPDGYEVTRTSGGHYAVISPSGARVYSLPSTPGRGRALANLRAALRREGIL